jgi:hypothetical protein
MKTELRPLLYHGDRDSSEIAFSIKHLLISKVKGHFDRFRGEFHLDPGGPEKSRVEGFVEAVRRRSSKLAAIEPRARILLPDGVGVPECSGFPGFYLPCPC